MPKLKPTRKEELNRIARSVLMGYLMERGYSRQIDLALFCDISQPTACRRFTDPGEMKVSELRQMKLTPEQIVQIVNGGGK